jgi:hypothetical protein
MCMDSVWIIEKSSAVIQSYDLSGPDDVFFASVVVQESAVGHRISSESLLFLKSTRWRRPRPFLA